jgi:hypothetical protein
MVSEIRADTPADGAGARRLVAFDLTHALHTPCSRRAMDGTTDSRFPLTPPLSRRESEFLLRHAPHAATCFESNQ